MNKRKTRRRASDELDEPDVPQVPTAAFDPENDLPGWVFMAPNRDWDIKSMTSEDHPGACTFFQQGATEATAVKGTDSENIAHWRRRSQFFVAPTERNGLTKETAFDLVPRYIQLRRILLFYPDRHLGWLDDDTLRNLRLELARLHPSD